MDLHPFWGGFLGELRKEAVVGEAVQFAKEHPVATAAGVGAAGIGGILAARKLGLPGFKKAVPAAEAAASGFSGKHMAIAGLGGAALGAYLMKKHKDRQ